MESNRNAQLIIPSKFCFPELNDIIESRGLWMLKLCENIEYNIHKSACIKILKELQFYHEEFFVNIKFLRHS